MARHALAHVLAPMLLAAPAMVQGQEPALDPAELPAALPGGRGDFLAIGIGVAVNPSYSGSDDYVLSPVPLVQGSIGGVQISPRGAGVRLDFIPDGSGSVGLDLGLAGRLRSDRARQIRDPSVKALGRLERAIEIGPSAGINLRQVLNPFDTLSIGTEVMVDINGAHGGVVMSPSISYFTPLSQATVALLSLGAEWADGGFHDYYFRITPDESAASGGVLPAFAPNGGGFTSLGVNLLLAHDLSGDLRDGGWGVFGFAGYARLLGDARATPFTSVVGTPNQLIGAVGLGYTF